MNLPPNSLRQNNLLMNPRPNSLNLRPNLMKLQNSLLMNFHPNSLLVLLQMLIRQRKARPRSQPSSRRSL